MIMGEILVFCFIGFVIFVAFVLYLLGFRGEGPPIPKPPELTRYAERDDLWDPL